MIRFSTSHKEGKVGSSPTLTGSDVQADAQRNDFRVDSNAETAPSKHTITELKSSPSPFRSVEPHPTRPKARGCEGCGPPLFCQKVVRRLRVAARKPAWRGRLRRLLSHGRSVEQNIAIVHCPDALQMATPSSPSQAEVSSVTENSTSCQALDAKKGKKENTRAPHMKGCELRVQVQGARRLTAADMDSTSDPFCIVRLGHREWTTQVLPHTLNPQWGETFTFTSQDLLSSDLVLELEVWSWDDWHPNDFLGQAHVNLRRLPLDVGPSTPAVVVPLYCMTPSGHKEGGDFGDVVLAVWTVPESDKCEREDPSSVNGAPQVFAPTSPASPSPALPAALPDGPVTSLCELPDACKQLPSLLHTDKGTIYEEPCIVLIQLTLGSLTITRTVDAGPVTTLMEQSTPEGVKKRMKRASRYIRHLFGRGFSGQDHDSGKEEQEEEEEVYHEDDSDSDDDTKGREWEEHKHKHKHHWVPRKKRRPVVVNSHSPGTASQASGDVAGCADTKKGLNRLKRVKWKLTDLQGGQQEAQELTGPPEEAPDESEGDLEVSQLTASQAGDWEGYVYCQVEYAKQVQTTRMRHTGGRGHVCVDHTFLFADVRPLRDRRVTITTYCSTTPSSRGRVAGMAEVNLRDLVMASAAAQLRDVGEGRPANRGSVYGDPLQMVELTMKEDQGTLQLHAGLADVDYRAQIHQVDLHSQLFSTLPAPQTRRSQVGEGPNANGSKQDPRVIPPPSPVPNTTSPGVRTVQESATSPYLWGNATWGDDGESTPAASRPTCPSPPLSSITGTWPKAPLLPGPSTACCCAQDTNTAGHPPMPRGVGMEATSGPRSAPGSFRITLQRVDVFSPEVPFFLVMRCGPLWVRTKTFPPGPAAILDWPLELPLYAPNVSLRLALFSDPSGEGAGLTLLVKSTPELLGRGGLNLGRVTPWKDKDKAVNIRGPASSNGDSAAAALVGICYVRVRVHYPSVWTLLSAYITPPHPPAFYELGLDKREEQQSLKVQRQIVLRWLSRSNPPLAATTACELLETGREKFTLDRLKTNFSRVGKMWDKVDSLIRDFDDICQWRDPLRSLVACGLVVGVSLHPAYLPLMILLGVGILFWRQGTAEEETWESDRGLAPEAATSTYAAPSVVDDAPVREEEVEVPLGAYNDLKRRYNQVVHRVLVVQNMLDDLACTMERLQALFNFDDKGATSIFACGCVLVALLMYKVGIRLMTAAVGLWILRPPALRDPLPPIPAIFFSWIPTKSDSF